MDSSDHARQLESSILLSNIKPLHQIENEYAVIENAIAIVKNRTPNHHHWVATRLGEIKERAIYCEMLLARLARAEAAYRCLHDVEGGGGHALVTGRAWDVMRRCGDEAREFLGTNK